MFDPSLSYSSTPHCYRGVHLLLLDLSLRMDRQFQYYDRAGLFLFCIGRSEGKVEGEVSRSSPASGRFPSHVDFSL